AVSPGKRSRNGDSSANLRTLDVTAAPLAVPRNPRRDRCFAILTPSFTSATCASCCSGGHRLNDVLFLDHASKKVKPRRSDSFTGCSGPHYLESLAKRRSTNQLASSAFASDS